MKKKAQLGLEQFGKMAIALVALGILLAVSMIIMTNVRTTTNDLQDCCLNKTQFYNESLGKCCKVSGSAVNCTVATTVNPNLNLIEGCAASKTVQSSLGDIPGWLSIIVIVIIGAVLLGLISLFRRQ